MATIKTETSEMIVEDGLPIKEACRELGVPFGCESGLCATCEIEVIEGMKNLEPYSDQEKELRMDGNRRLACQCVLKQGDIKIRY